MPPFELSALPEEFAVVAVVLVTGPTFAVPAKDGSADNEPRTRRYSRVSVPLAHRSEETGRSSESFDPSQVRNASCHFISQNSVRQLMLVNCVTKGFTDCGIFYQMDRQAQWVIHPFFSASPEDSGKTRVRVAISAGFVRKFRSLHESCPQLHSFLFIYLTDPEKMKMSPLRIRMSTPLSQFTYLGFMYA